MHNAVMLNTQLENHMMGSHVLDLHKSSLLVFYDLKFLLPKVYLFIFLGKTVKESILPILHLLIPSIIQGRTLFREGNLRATPIGMWYVLIIILLWGSQEACNSAFHIAQSHFPPTSILQPPGISTFPLRLNH